MPICPRCKSADLLYLPWLGQLWSCRGCSYKGPLYIESAQRALFEALRRIPRGKVTTYAALGKLVFLSPRQVAALLRKNPRPDRYPCFKVVHADGRIGGYAFGGKRKKASLLNAEGIAIRKGKINLKKFGYDYAAAEESWYS